MKATYETVTKFAQKYGTVKILDTKSQTRILPSGEPDTVELVEKADQFWFEDNWYKRGDFETLMERSSTNLELTELVPPVTAGCKKRQCVNNATYAVTWNRGHGRKQLRTTHKKELEQRPWLLGTWFQLGPSPQTTQN